MWSQPRAHPPPTQVPISLYVSLEIVKWFQARAIEGDAELAHFGPDGRVKPALARTSNLNEDLGQVEYVFSDKTGTLTQNEMELKRVCIGRAYVLKEVYTLRAVVVSNDWVVANAGGYLYGDEDAMEDGQGDGELGGSFTTMPELRADSRATWEELPHVQFRSRR